MKDKLQDHKFLIMLKYAYENKTFTKKEMLEIPGLSLPDIDGWLAELAQKVSPRENEDMKQKWTMKYEAFLNYMEYIELHEARESSKKAKRLSIIAIFISAFLAVTSIIISIYQIMTPSVVSLEEHQINKIIETEK